MILERAWRAGQDLDLAALIHQIQSPPVERVGVLDLESFFSAKDRFELAMAVNNLIASPGFSNWTAGESLDIGRLLYTASGKPRVAIFSIAHLTEPQRMFFVSLLLNEVLGWVRTQTGSSSLRAILYMDEIAGYVPPVAAPPSKAPLLTLMKQARAYGVGIVLATQNPVDLDYKGLSNAGTWFLGRLQTERDKARVLDGLEGVATTSGARFDRAGLERTLSSLESRVFLMNNVHEDAPEIFQTRWALSYLRGPLSREDIKRLMSDRIPAASEPVPAVAGGRPPTDSRVRVPSAAGAAPSPDGTRAVGDRPALPPEVPQYFAPARGDAAPRYVPMLLGSAQIRYADTRAKVDLVEDVLLVTPISEGPAPIDWTSSSESAIPLNAFAERPAEGATFATLPAVAAKAKSYEAWSKAFAAWLAANRRLSLCYCEPLKLTSRPYEDERSFRIRLQQAARERRDAAVDLLRRKYAPKLASLQDRLRRAAQTTEVQSGQVTEQVMQTTISMVATAVGMLFNRKASGTALGRATTAARGMGRTMREREDVTRARDNESALQQQKESLEHDLAAEIAGVESTLDATALPLEPLTLVPKKSHVTVRFVALAWVPRTSD
jgi:hypothetical protein